MCFIVLILVACTTIQKEYKETSECMNYRNMMTAPMDPRAIEDLRIKCEKSQQKS